MTDNRDVRWSRHGESRRKEASLQDAKNQMNPKIEDEKPEAQIGIHSSSSGEDNYFLSLDIEMHGSRKACLQVKEKLESLLRDTCVAPVEPIDR